MSADLYFTHELSRSIKLYTFIGSQQDSVEIAHNEPTS